jgi:membrane-associated phospholipid phosphatase
MTWVGSLHDVALGLASAALLIVFAMLLTPWCKLSLHTGFAMHAAVLLTTVSWLAFALGCVFAAAISWSRIALSRHGPRDLILGALAGAMSAALFLALHGMTR